MEPHREPTFDGPKPKSGRWQLSLFGWVLVLYLLVCVLPAGAVLWVMSRQIDDHIRVHNRQQSQVSSLVHSVQQKAKTGLGNAISLPKQLTEELAAKQLTAAGSPDEFLNRYVCATALPEAADRADVRRLVELLKPRRPDAADRPAALRAGEDRTLIRDFFPPLRAFLSDPDASTGRRPDLDGLLAWLAQDSRRYEEIVALVPTLARELPPCNAVLLVDGGESRLPVLAHNTLRRYGQAVPANFRKPAGLAATLGGGASADRVARMVRSLADNPRQETLLVSDRFEDLDVFGDYRDAQPDDYRRWSLVVAAQVDLPPLVAGAVRSADGRLVKGPVLAVFVVSWTLIQAEIASDQLYKRSRNLDRLRMLVLERGPGGLTRCIASGVPGLFNEVADPEAVESSPFGPSLARQLTTVPTGSADRMGSNQRQPVEFAPGPVAPPSDLPALLLPMADAASATNGPPELLFGELRPVDQPSAPGEWRVLDERGEPLVIDWLALIYYDPEEGSVGPRIRQWNMLTSLLLVAVMLAASWYIARTLSAPTNALRDMAQSLAAGQFHLTGDAATLLVPRSWAHPREIAELETAFRDMAAQVVTKRSLEEKNAELRDNNRRLDETVGELTTARNALQERGHQLEDKNAELERTISQLREAQQELMVSNMLASLGTISGEYAHAVNNGLQLPLYTLDELAGQLRRAASGHPDGEVRGPTTLSLSEEMADNIRTSMETIQHTAAFVTQFRDFARSDSYEMSPLELNRVVASVADVWRPQLRRRQIELSAKLGDPPTVLGNDALIMHVLVNLILNSRDAIRQRRNQSEEEAALVGQITLTTDRDGDGSALLSIADNGCGISPEVAARIFQPMFTTKPRGEGSGLGLSSVLRAVRQHSGQIWFDSGAGRGTTFHIRLPAAG